MSQTDEFLGGLEKSLGYVRGFVASKLVFELLQEGLFELLNNSNGGIGVEEVAREKKYDPELLEAVFEYLVVEDILKKEDNNPTVKYSTTSYGKNLEKYKGWFNLLIGGYGPVFSDMGKMLREGRASVSRTGKHVGIGSCQISYYDSIPLTKRLIEKTKPDAKRFVDFGCGNALYLCTFCEEMDGIQAVGIEPDRESYEAGLQLVAEKGLGDRVSLVNCDALSYEFEDTPDFVLFGFVLHEVYAQIGEKELIRFIGDMGKKFSDSNLLVIEVDYDIDNHSVMKTPMGIGYYNPYYLLHPFTNQKLLPKEKWEEIFSRAGFSIVEKEIVDPAVDPTGLEIGYVLRYTKNL